MSVDQDHQVRGSFLASGDTNDLKPGDCVLIKRVQIDSVGQTAMTYRTVLFYKGGFLYDAEGSVVVMNRRLAAGVEILEHFPYGDDPNSRIWLALDRDIRQTTSFVFDESHDGVEMQRIRGKVRITYFRDLVPRCSFEVSADELDQIALQFASHAAVLRNGQ